MELRDNNTISKKCCKLCHTEIDLKKCSKCRSVWYCSKEHQTEDWKRHKDQECKIFCRTRESQKKLALGGLKKEDFSLWKERARSNSDSVAHFNLGLYYQYGFG